MKRALLLAALTLGCSPGVTRVTVDVARAMCALLDAVPAGGAAARAPVAFDVSPDGGVRAVYP